MSLSSSHGHPFELIPLFFSGNCSLTFNWLVVWAACRSDQSFRQMALWLLDSFHAFRLNCLVWNESVFHISFVKLILGARVALKHLTLRLFVRFRGSSSPHATVFISLGRLWCFWRSNSKTKRVIVFRVSICSLNHGFHILVGHNRHTWRRNKAWFLASVQVPCLWCHSQLYSFSCHWLTTGRAFFERGRSFSHVSMHAFTSHQGESLWCSLSLRNAHSLGDFSAVTNITCWHQKEGVLAVLWCSLDLSLHWRLDFATQLLYRADLSVCLLNHSRVSGRLDLIVQVFQESLEMLQHLLQNLHVCLNVRL